ncbi:hypothetical protein Nepgr_002034 [Nepenthes gracilis]|uniref:BHLH domain-containing protein n=1 Tax=Nepenthes gracilis TaxID=150966 RepID=A0AAD3P3C4_NEPGR|nr:hypothetical protein Nepgr_002034 [Nepenthes gracilis]
MALEAVVFSQDPFLSYCCKDLYTLGGGCTNDFVTPIVEETDKALHVTSKTLSTIQNANNCECSYSSKEGLAVGICLTGEVGTPMEAVVATTDTATVRRKRRRMSTKNKEEVENQRMTHIAVERNRRKQMNEYLAVIRSLMPPPYVQRGDQASIIGGAINYVKELEQLLQSLEAQRRFYKQQGGQDDNASCSPFADFFTFRRYSTRSNLAEGNNNNSVSFNDSDAGDVEVTMVESHANVKILAKKQPKQLLKLMTGFQSLRLSVLHLNVTTVDQMVLHSFSLKIEEGSQLNSSDKIAAAAKLILRKLQEEASLIV